MQKVVIVSDNVYRSTVECKVLNRRIECGCWFSYKLQTSFKTLIFHRYISGFSNTSSF